MNLIYDVGLHRGEDTDYYLRKGFDVVAFEANPHNAAFCRERFAEALQEGRLTIVEGAIAENPTLSTVKFYLNTEHSLWSTSSADFSYRSEVLGTRHDVIEVPAIDFGHCLAKYGIPYYLKADIVGSELVCLRAMLAFANRPDYVSIRSEKVVFSRLEQEFKLLEDLGYNRFQAVQQCVENLRARPDSREGKPVAYTFAEGSSGLFGRDLRGRWLNKEAVVRQYHWIFVSYWLFGDYSYLMQSERGRRFIRRLEGLVRRPLPGWYDTHAKQQRDEG